LIEGVLIEGVLIEGVLIEGVLIEGVLIEGVLIEGVLIEGVSDRRRFWPKTRARGSRRSAGSSLGPPQRRPSVRDGITCPSRP
jgi:hypothetical protein